MHSGRHFRIRGAIFDIRDAITVYERIFRVRVAFFIIPKTTF